MKTKRFQRNVAVTLIAGVLAAGIVYYNTKALADGAQIFGVCTAIPKSDTGGCSGYADENGVCSGTRTITTYSGCTSCAASDNTCNTVVPCTQCDQSTTVIPCAPPLDSNNRPIPGGPCLPGTGTTINSHPQMHCCQLPISPTFYQLAVVN
jgi:hypothetical protein